MCAVSLLGVFSPFRSPSSVITGVLNRVLIETCQDLRLEKRRRETEINCAGHFTTGRYSFSVSTNAQWRLSERKNGIFWVHPVRTTSGNSSRRAKIVALYGPIMCLAAGSRRLSVACEHVNGDHNNNWKQLLFR